MPTPPLDQTYRFTDVDPTDPDLDLAASAGAQELPRPELQRTPEIEAVRARLADELFGVAMETPRIGRFRVIEMLGRGGMGQVYAAYDDELDRRVAVKILHTMRDAGPRARARMLREAQALARLSHPNVVQIHEVGEHAGQIYVAMEYIRGRGLADWLADLDDGPRRWEAVLDVFVAAGRGLQAAHEAGLVHRDFKPANVLVGADGRARVLDFGLARWSDDRSPHDQEDMNEEAGDLDGLTATGALLGTPVYMSPELFAGGGAGPASDQYAFCVALHEGLYGCWPHPGKTIAELVAAKSSGAIAPPPPRRRVPGWLHAALVRGLAVEPCDRWPSMAALLAEIGRDRRAATRRNTLRLAAVALVGAAGIAGVQAWQAVRESARAERAELVADALARQSERADFERAVLAAAEQAAEVLRLSATPGHERDALVRGIQLASPHAPDFTGAPAMVFDGLAAALPALIPQATLDGRHAAVRVAFSPDDTRLASLHGDGSLQLWDARNRANIWTTPRIEGINSASLWSRLAFDPGGTQLLTDGVGPREQPRCTLWSTSTGELVREFSGCVTPQFTADGVHVVGQLRAGEARAGIAAWDVATGAMAWRSDGDDFGEMQLAGGGASLIIARGDNSIDIRDVDDGRLVARLPPVPGAKASRFNRLGLAHTRDLLAVNEAEGELRLWDLTTRTLLRSLGPADGAPRFSHDDRRLIADGWRQRLYDVAAGDLLAAWPEPSVEAIELAGGVVVTHMDTSIILRSVDTGHLITRTRGHRGWIRGIAASPGGDRFATASDDGTVRLWKTGDPRVLERRQPPPGERVIAFADDFVATIDPAGVTRIRASAADAPLVTIPPYPGIFGLPRVVRVDGGYLVWPSAIRAPGEWTLQFFDERTGDQMFRHVVPHGDTEILDVEPAPARDARRVAVPGLDGSLEVLDTVTGRRVCAFTGDGSFSHAAALHDDGTLAATIDRHGKIVAWDLRTCQQAFSITSTSSESHVREFRFVGTDSLLVQRDGRTSVHTARTGAVRLTVQDPCPADHYGDSDLSPDGTRLVTYCYGPGRAWIRDVPSGELVAILDDVDPYGDVDDRFSRTGDRFTLRADDGDVLVLDAHTGALVVRVRDLARSEWHAPKLASGGSTLHLHQRGGDVLTLPASRAGVFAAACRALADTDAHRDVLDHCAGRG